MRRIWNTFIVIVLLYCLLFSTVSCVKTREELTPESMGEAEGLYLYVGNYRSLTDGSQREEILKEVVVEGQTYSSDEFEINNIEYVQEKKNIFYLIEIPKDDNYIYVFLKYDYDEKESLIIDVFYYGMDLYRSNYYIYLRGERKGQKCGQLYDLDGNLIATELLDYYLHDDILIKPFGGILYWWKDGKNFKFLKASSNYFYHKDYLYIFGVGVIYICNASTGETVEHALTSTEKYLSSAETYKEGWTTESEDFFVITYSKISELRGRKSFTGCKLYKLNGASLTFLHLFDPDYEVRFKQAATEERASIVLEEIVPYGKDSVDFRQKYAYLNKKTGKVHSDFLLSSVIETEKTIFRDLTVGEYRFYVTRVSSNHIMFAYYCYYLHREHNGKDEIINYWMPEEDEYREFNLVLFDDICEN